MANISAAQSGNWSATSTWNGGVVPGPGDTAYANTFTITIDTNVTCNTISNASGTGITAGGFFQILSSGITVTLAQGMSSGVIGAASGLLRTSHATGTSTVTAQSNGFVGGPSSSYQAIVHSGGGILAVNGPLTASGSASAYTVLNNGTGTVTITGDVLGASGNNQAVFNNSSGIVNIIGNVSGNAFNGGNGALNNATGTVNVTGNVIGGTGGSAYGINNVSTGTINVTGNVTGGPDNRAPGVYNSSTGAVTVTGDVFGDAAVGVNNASTGRLTITGNIYASASSSAVNNASTGGVRVGTAGATSLLSRTGAVLPINGLWMVVAGADVVMFMPTDSAYPAYSGTSVSLSAKGTTLGSGLVLLNDIAAVVGEQIAAAKGA